MRTLAEVEAVLALVPEGHSDREIAARTGVPRRTISDWRRGHIPGRSPRSPRAECRFRFGQASPSEKRAYAYLLGLYLGDGCISRSGRVFRLRFFLDARYPDIVDQCVAALEAVMAPQRAWAKRRKHYGCVEVAMYSKHWPCLFPQHGPGRKHLRRIELVDWQKDIVAGDHESFIKGLIHSDGCRVVANDRGVRSVRYHFSNRSDDIKRLFCASLDALGVPWTRSCERQIAVYRKDAVRELDKFIGPKS